MPTNIKNIVLFYRICSVTAYLEYYFVLETENHKYIYYGKKEKRLS